MFEDEHDLKQMGMVGLLVGPTKKKARIETKAGKYAAKKDAFPHSKIIDVLRCKFICQGRFDGGPQRPSGAARAHAGGRQPLVRVCRVGVPLRRFGPG